MTCTCFQWQSTGIPCSHAIAAILVCREDPQTYVQAFLSLDAYRHTYTATIHTLNADKADGNESNGDNAIIAPAAYLQDNDDIKENRIICPYACRQPGRPRVNGIKS